MDKITQVQDEALAAIAGAQNPDELQQVRIQYLGKKGSIQALMAEMKSLPKEEKPAFGQKVNVCKQTVTEALEKRQEELNAGALVQKMESETLNSLQLQKLKTEVFIAEVMETESGEAFSGGEYVLPREMLEYCEKLYEGEGTDPEDPYYSPVKGTKWNDFPPCVFVHAGCDPLRGDGKAFARLLQNSGVKISEILASGMMHGFALYWWRFRRGEEILLHACERLCSFVK